MSKIQFLLDVVEDMRNLADSIQAVADAMSNRETPQPDPAPPAAPPAAPVAPEKVITLEEVRAVLSEKSHVTIKSIGPYCDENEILHLCDKGFCSENAKIAQSIGQGFGLNFAQKICLAHNIGISFDSAYMNKDHGVKYGTFRVHLHFDNSVESAN